MTDTTSHHILHPQGYTNPSTTVPYQNDPGMNMSNQQQQAAPMDPRQGQQPQQQQHHLYQSQARQGQQAGYSMVK